MEIEDEMDKGKEKLSQQIQFQQRKKKSQRIYKERTAMWNKSTYSNVKY